MNSLIPSHIQVTGQPSCNECSTRSTQILTSPETLKTFTDHSAFKVFTLLPTKLTIKCFKS